MGKKAYLLNTAGRHAVRLAGSSLLSKGSSRSILSFFSVGSILSAGSILGLGSAGYSPSRERDDESFEET